MAETARPPVLLTNVIDEREAVVGLLERNAPYTPLGGWFRPGVDEDAATSPMWFQADWVHADLAVEGSDLFHRNPRYLEAARAFWNADFVLPHSLYVNVMVGIDRAGPAHTDNPKFRGRERSNTPMWLLRTMLWSGLFERWEIHQATAIWWLDDIEGGGLLYWADGPDRPPRRHEGAMANTALVGDNHHMFHQVERVGPFDGDPILVTQRAQLAPTRDGSGDWSVVDRGREVFRAPLDRYRVSVLWKADVYASEASYRAVSDDRLGMEDVARVFDEDLARRGERLRFDGDRLADPAFQAALAAVYPEAIPVEAGRSMYDAA
ncbi:MAG TPA: hypothetical protein PLW10_03810 [Myxococcota bacterium]|nr:hypothetical protein [Myxococcales bacterium]HPG24734.1 hypothetical protein [Myxococcota bacterium]